MKDIIPREETSEERHPSVRSYWLSGSDSIFKAIHKSLWKEVEGGSGKGEGWVEGQGGGEREGRGQAEEEKKEGGIN